MKKRPISLIRMKGLMTVLLIAAFTVCFMLQSGAAVYSEDGVPSMNLHADVLAGNVNTKNAQKVWYADKTWDVIGFDGRGVAGTSGAVTLLSAGNLGDSKFDSSGSNVYAGSMLRKKIEGYNKEDGSHVSGAIDDFSETEQKAIVKRTLRKGGYNLNDTDCVAGTDVPDAPLWPLSTKEANKLAGELFRDITWWLRSPGDGNNKAANVYKGYVVNYGKSVDFTYGVRPFIWI